MLEWKHKIERNTILNLELLKSSISSPGFWSQKIQSSSSHPFTFSDRKSSMKSDNPDPIQLSSLDSFPETECCGQDNLEIQGN